MKMIWSIVIEGVDRWGGDRWGGDRKRVYNR